MSDSNIADETVAPVTIILDAGNSDIKAMIHGDFNNEIWFPHAVQRPGPAEYTRTATQLKYAVNGMGKGSSVFRYESPNSKHGQVASMGVVIGKKASEKQHERLLGPAKYRREHLGPILCAALLQLGIESNDNITVIGLHPTDVSAENLEAYRNAVSGTHIVTLPDGNKRSYRVRNFAPIAEPSAVAMTYILTVEGDNYVAKISKDSRLRPGSRVLVLDVGGGLCSFVPVMMESDHFISVDPDAAPPITQGIEDVTRVFKTEIQSTLYDKIGKIQKLPDDMLHDALKTSQIELSGDEIKCDEAVESAIATIANPIRAMYNRDFAEGRPYRAIIIGGGGGSIVEPYLKRHVLNHNYIYLAEHPARMRFGAIRGASKGYALYLKAQGK